MSVTPQSGNHLGYLMQQFQRSTSILPLVIFRIAFGLLMFFSTLRFISNGWVVDLYITPQFHFTYLWFDWVQPLPGPWMFLPFVLLLMLSLNIMVGFAYRFSMTLSFLSFTYIELIDKAYYLNHYYFISLLSFLLIFLPLHRAFSIDVRLHPHLRLTHVPAWTIGAIQLQLSLVYLFAGAAKLYDDWLLRGIPLNMWLPSRTDFPVLGRLFGEPFFGLLMSWAGALYDLTIPLWLLWRRTRWLAYLAVIGFHILTGMLFPIGIFPWIMIVSALIFFDECDYRTLYTIAGRFLRLPTWPEKPASVSKPTTSFGVKPLWLILSIFFIFQVMMPLRFLFYPGYVNWTEQGYRFAWRVMLVEKAGLALFNVTDLDTGDRWTVHPAQYLTRHQEKQMAFQPDMILQFAHFIEQQAIAEGRRDVAVQADVWVAFNGRRSQPYIDPTVDLTLEQNGLHHKDWILPPAY